MQPNTTNMQTDTHLSKDFNKILQNCIFQCNMMGNQVKSSPHYEYLLQYQATIDTLFINTFYLFETIPFKKTTLSLALMEKVAEIQSSIYNMKYYPSFRSRNYFDKVVNLCTLVQMMIMAGLQRRKMLVRMSESEPKGAHSIEYWDTKETFKKGDLKLEKIDKGYVVGGIK